MDLSNTLVLFLCLMCIPAWYLGKRSAGSVLAGSRFLSSSVCAQAVTFVNPMNNCYRALFQQCTANSMCVLPIIAISRIRIKRLKHICFLCAERTKMRLRSENRPSEKKKILIRMEENDQNEHPFVPFETSGSTAATVLSSSVARVAFGQALSQLDDFFDNSMRDLLRREIEADGIVLLSQRRLELERHGMCLILNSAGI